MLGYNAALTGNFIKVNLDFDPTADFHEYRIDYLPAHVYFYVDDVMLGSTDGPAVPASPGHLVLQHWSNGNELWSGGPPSENSVVSVQHVRAYFNSSSPQRHQDWARRCNDPKAPKAICKIPDLATEHGSNASEWLFSEHGNMTNNQTVYGLNRAPRRQGMPLMTLTVALIFIAGWAFVL